MFLKAVKQSHTMEHYRPHEPAGPWEQPEIFLCPNFVSEIHLWYKHPLEISQKWEPFEKLTISFYFLCQRTLISCIYLSYFLLLQSVLETTLEDEFCCSLKEFWNKPVDCSKFSVRKHGRFFLMLAEGWGQRPPLCSACPDCVGNSFPCQFCVYRAQRASVWKNIHSPRLVRNQE